MCGRFTFTGNIKWLIDHFLLPAMPTFANRFNIAPLQPVLAIIYDHDRKVFAWDFFSWGLVPPWAEDCSQAAKMINARSETLLDRPSYKKSIQVSQMHYSCIWFL